MSGSTLVAAGGAGAGPVPAAKSAQGPGAGTTCSFRAARERISSKPRRKHIVLSARCNYLVKVANFTTSRTVSAVRTKPVLEGATAIDHFGCRKVPLEEQRGPASGKVSASCAGSVGPNVRFKATLRLTQKTCGHRKPLRIRMQVTGGPDCRAPGLVCPAIAYGTVRRTTINC